MVDTEEADDRLEEADLARLACLQVTLRRLDRTSIVLIWSNRFAQRMCLFGKERD